MSEVNVKVRPNIVPGKGDDVELRNKYLHGAVRRASERSVRFEPEVNWLTRVQLQEWALTVTCSRCGSAAYYCGCE